MTELATETFGPLTWYGIDYGADMPRGEHHVPPLAALTPPGYISTYTGRFTPLAPRAIDVDIRDIAHSLAMQCRYAGHVRKFYCPTPDQRILTADLKWIAAGDLRVGDDLLGFDEEPVVVGGGRSDKRRRKHRHARVTYTNPIKRPTIRLVMEDGSEVTASSEHPWLVATKVSRNQKWLTAGEIANDIRLGRKRYMHKFYDPWKQQTSHRAGWLAGIFDGEGSFSTGNRRGVTLGVAQRTGLVLDEIVSSLRGLGFHSATAHSAGGTNGNVVNIQMRGGFKEASRFLGEIRPIRLLDKFKSRLIDGTLDKQMEGKCAPLEIVHAVDEGEQWVSGIETSTHTYFCEGYGAHNSVAEHSVHIARWLLENAPHAALHGLLHDAPEAYLVDVPRPVKKSLYGYKQAEAAVWDVIAEAFSLSRMIPPEVHEADNRIIADEMMQNMHECDPSYNDPLEITLDCWDPARAEREFLDMYRRLL